MAVQSQATAGTIRHDERRRSRRQHLLTVGVLCPPIGAGGSLLQVQVLDVSIHGIGFRSPVSFSRGRLYQMRIGTGPLQLASQLKIVNCRPRPDGTFDIGAEFS